ncbi:MAG: ferritin family protein [Bacillota bacterium]
MRELLENALEFEREGHCHYKALAAGTRNALGKRLFEVLAEEELDHARRVETLYKAIQGGREPKALEASDRTPLEERMRECFLGLYPAERALDMDNVEGLETAMERERQGLKMYQRLLEATGGDQAGRAFLESLVEEEWEHLEALVNTYRYLTLTAQWFDEEESKRWNWMNT